MEVDEAERIALQQGINDSRRFLALPFGVDVVALVLRLNRQATVETKKTLSLKFVVLKTFYDVRDSVLLQFGFYDALLCLISMR